MTRPQPLRRPTRNSTGNRFPAYPAAQSESAPALSPDLIPLSEDVEALDASSTSEAEALGTDAASLHREIHDEESQRHPGVHADDEDASGIEALAEVFHRRLGDRH